MQPAMPHAKLAWQAGGATHHNWPWPPHGVQETPTQLYPLLQKPAPNPPQHTCPLSPHGLHMFPLPHWKPVVQLPPGQQF